MKQFKMMIPLMALVLGLVGAFAFTPAPQKGAMTESWFEIINPAGNQHDPSNYKIVSGTPACDETTQLCAVYALVDPESAPENEPENLKPDEQDIANLNDNQRRYQD